MNETITPITAIPEILDCAAQWFCEKWNIPKSAYLESMTESLKAATPVPQWYLALEDGRIVGGLGVIENDFHDRRELSPNICAVYVEDDRRGRGIAGRLLEFAERDMASHGIGTLYLVTDHVGFYERYGWQYYGTAHSDGEDKPSRVYIHEQGSIMKEYLDIINEDGEPTGRVVERGYAHENGIPHRTAHLWLVRRKNGAVEILLQKRAAHKDSYPGCFDISSAGHIPAGVEYRRSAVRELKEELGIDANEDELIHCGDRRIHTDHVFFGRPFHDRQCSRVFMLWRDIEPSGFTLQTEEVECVKWMPLGECIDGVKNDAFEHCIASEELEMLKTAIEKYGEKRGDGAE